MAGDGLKMDRRIGRAADRRAGDDRVLERGAGQNIGRLEVLAHDLDGAHAGLIGDRARSRYGAGMAAQPGSDMPSASAMAFMVEAVPMVLQWPIDGADEAAMSMNSS